VQVARENSKDADVLLVSFDLMVPRADKALVSKRVAEFVAERKWGVPTVVFDPADLDALNEKFNLPGAIPVTLAFDKFGNIADREEGPAERARFASLLESAR